MAQFLNQNKLPLLLFKPLFDFSVAAKFKAETSASSSVSSRLPVISLQKASHISHHHKEGRKEQQIWRCRMTI
jgi:hypothetical protein